MVDFNEVDWIVSAQILPIMLLLFVSSVLFFIVPGIIWTTMREKKGKPSGEGSPFIAALLTVLIPGTFWVFASHVQGDSFDEFSAELNDSMETEVVLWTEDDIKFNARNWSKALRDFNGEEEHRVDVVVREQGEPEVDAVLLFERDDAEYEEFTVSLMVVENARTDTRFVPYHSESALYDNNGWNPSALLENTVDPRLAPGDE